MLQPRPALRSACLLLIALLVEGPGTARADERETRHERATREISRLHFFAEGDGLHLSPNLWGTSTDLMKLPLVGVPANRIRREVFARRWGIPWIGRPAGIFDVQYDPPDGKPMSVGVLGCVACHGGKAAGRYFVGLGNKNIDVHQIGSDALLVEKSWKLIDRLGTRDGGYERVQASAIAFAKTLSNPRITNLTQGLVPTAVIRSWFYRVAGREMPEHDARAAVKVPHVWGFGEKRKAGKFCDGFAGEDAGWGAAVELVAGQRPEVVRKYLPEVERVENLFGDLLPPRYPFAIDPARAERGRGVFQATCARCHGGYARDASGLPIYQQPKYIPWELVRTDRDRLDGNSPEFLELVRTSPLNDVMQFNEGKGAGYFAPRLDAVWARFPYLHNASVPSVRALLTAPEDRPRAFSLEDAGEERRFDPAALGLSTPAPGSRQERSLLKRGRAGRRDVYFVERPGQSNQGHPFGTSLPDDAKADLIEYLKTL